MYNTYPSDFTTYEEVNEQIKALTSGSDLTADKTAILQYIHDASRMIVGWTHRTFIPYIDTSAQVLYDISPHRVQKLPDDTLSVTSIQDTAGDTVTSSLYRLRSIYNDLNAYPYGYFELSSSADYSTTDTNDFSRTWTIDGVFGYSNQPYTMAWLDTTTLGANIDATTTTVFDVSDATNIDTLDYIRVNDEFMQVTAISTNTLTVKRGVNGSTAVATHLSGDTVEVWQVNDAVKLACTRLAAWLYSSRQNEYQSIQFQDGTVASIRYPQIVRASLQPYVKPIVESIH